MSKLKIMLVMLLLIHISSNSYCSFVVDAATDGAIVGGVIRRDTIWTKENNPYILNDDITIRPDITLRIQEGVVVDFSLWSMIIDGELIARGVEGEPIEFHLTVMPLTGYKDARIVFTETSRPWRESNNRGSQFEYVDMYCDEDTVRYGLVEGGTLKLDHVAIYDSGPYSKHYTLNFNGSITNSEFVRVTRAIIMEEGEIVDNTFLNSTSTVITIYDGLVRDNYINGGRRGINVKNALVKNNTIINIDYRGINIYNEPVPGSTDEVRPVINHNLVMNCGEDAIYVSGDIRPIITQNVIYENFNGIYFNENAFYEGIKPQIYNNVFYANENNAYFDREDPRIEIKLQNNWWGTNDTELIEDKIYYESDDPRITAALYQPILSELPYYIPKIPFTITLSHPSQEVEVDDVIPVYGRVYPPLEGSELSLTYNGPDGQMIKKTVNTDVYGVFTDEQAPDSNGTWSVTVESAENLLLESRTASTQVLIIEAASIIADSSPDTIIEEDDDPVESTAPEIINETDDDPASVSTEQTTDEVPDIEYVSETVDTDSSSVAQIEEPASPREPFVFGLIPSVVTLVMLIALYLGVNGFKLR